MKLYTFIVMLLTSGSLWAKATVSRDTLYADGGHINIHLFYELLKTHGVEVKDGLKNRSTNWEHNAIRLPINSAGGLQLSAPHGGLKAVTGGQFYLQGGFEWSLQNGQKIDLNNLRIVPTSRQLKTGELTALEMVNDAGETLLLLDHIHAGFNGNNTGLNMENMDLRISPYLAKLINQPALSNYVIGHAHLYSQLVIPTDYQAKEFALGACTEGDNWPPGNPDVDVALISMSAQYVRDIGPDHVVITPSATLENVGTADVAWYRKFTGSFDPYGNDQHPYLVWNLYREIDNRFEQIGVSGVKHAFFTVNTSCSCFGGQVLYPTCTDTYSVGNNDSGSHLGPRESISVFDGLWQSTGSFFDQDGNGQQETSSNGTDENRMVVAEADFADNSLDYYMSSWYVIRDDIDIFNNIGYRQYSITPNGGGWLLSSSGGFQNGPASDQYVAPNTAPDLINGEASVRLLQAGEGHLTVAVKVIDLGAGLYRYNYMVENHDYDPRVQTITLPLNNSNSMTDWVFSDVDEDGSNDWVVTHSNGALRLQAPVDNEIDWGILYSFSFTSDAAPAVGNLTLTGLENGGTEFDAAVIVPSFDDLIFASDFENLN